MKSFSSIDAVVLLVRGSVIFGAFVLLAGSVGKIHGQPGKKQESLPQYVAMCKSELNFTPLAQDLNCYDGVVFARNQTVLNDHGIAQRVGDEADLMFACRGKLVGSKLVGDKNNPEFA